MSSGNSNKLSGANGLQSRRAALDLLEGVLRKDRPLLGVLTPKLNMTAPLGMLQEKQYL